MASFFNAGDGNGQMTRFKIQPYNVSGAHRCDKEEPVEQEVGDDDDLKRSLLQERQHGHDRRRSSNVQPESYTWYAPLKEGDDAETRVDRSGRKLSNSSNSSSSYHLLRQANPKSAPQHQSAFHSAVPTAQTDKRPNKPDSLFVNPNVALTTVPVVTPNSPSPTKSSHKLYRRSINSPSGTPSASKQQQLTVDSRNCLLPLSSATAEPSTASSGTASAPPYSYSPVAQRGRTFAARHTKRLVFKDGSCNVTSSNVTQKKKKYLVDIFTTCVDMRWRYLLGLFASAFLVSWIIFAIVWYLIAILKCNDQLQPYQTAETSEVPTRSPSLFEDFVRYVTSTSRASNESEETTKVMHSRRSLNDDPATNVSSSASETEPPVCQPCVNNVYDFATALLFSIETQHTIGYGYRVIEPNCWYAIALLMIQSCLGVFVQSLMTGLIFAKLSQPKKRAHTIMFSKSAVITKRDGVYCLLFRVGDMRRSHFVATSIRALLVKDRVTKEGECIPLCQFPLDVKTETSAGDAFVFMVWPVVVVHKIDSSSPLWDLSASQLLQERFEIIVIMEGIVESTGMTTQVRTSYLPSELLWGHCLAPLLTYQNENGQYKIDYAQFHAIVPMEDMPECSAKEYSTNKHLSGTDEAHVDISPYFTVPPKNKESSSMRSSVMQRVRGSLKLKRSKKDKNVPCTAPVVQTQSVATASANVFFATQTSSQLPQQTMTIPDSSHAAGTFGGERAPRKGSGDSTAIAASRPADLALNESASSSGLAQDVHHLSATGRKASNSSSGSRDSRTS